jgi:hypothetical protein
LGSYLRSHPEITAHCASLIRLVDVNQTTLDLYGVKDKTQLIGSLPATSRFGL